MPVVVAWKGEIATARNEPVDDDATYWRRALRNAKTEEQRQSILEQIDMAAWDIGAINVDQIGQPPSSDPEAGRFYASAIGALVPISEHLDEWLTTSRVTAKTQDMQRSDVQRFAARFAMVQDVTRSEVRRWITGLMNDDGLTPKTVQRILSASGDIGGISRASRLRERITSRSANSTWPGRTSAPPRDPPGSHSIRPMW